MLLLMVTFGSYSQCMVKKCTCCTKPTRVVHHIKKPVKPKHKPKPIVKPIANNVEMATNVTINYISTPLPASPVTQTVQKDTVVKIVMLIAEPAKLKPDTPEFEIYAGVVNPKQINTLGYMVGLNITPSLHQIGKNGKEREYLNKFLFGFEFSGYNTTPQSVKSSGSYTAPVTQSIVTTEDCNCEDTTLGGFTSGSTNSVNNLASTPDYTFKREIKGLSLNFGVEIYKGWFLISGVTAYNSKFILDDKTVNTTNSVYIDAGIKKFFKLGNVYLSPMVKFNELTSSFGVGFSYD